ncbi:Profilin [Mizuhopecten yessoensis]|uniref:Profilin n=1 Tax=Mizuhopecten yessoensis TaxID=6573 RepID=A0A210QQD2_MIZYE|nr:Profilin [Mizuhopecten yessoensis]
MSKPFNLTAHFETKGLVQRVKAFETLDAVKMNQLQNLIHDALISTNNVQHCAIVRRKDCNVRASSVGFNLYPDQVQMLLDAFKNPPQTREEGVYFDDGQYKCVRADKNSIYGKCIEANEILHTAKLHL